MELKELKKLKELKTIVFSNPLEVIRAKTYVFNSFNFLNSFNFPLQKVELLIFNS